MMTKYFPSVDESAIRIGDPNGVSMAYATVTDCATPAGFEDWVISRSIACKYDGKFYLKLDNGHGSVRVFDIDKANQLFAEEG